MCDFLPSDDVVVFTPPPTAPSSECARSQVVIAADGLGRNRSSSVTLPSVQVNSVKATRTYSKHRWCVDSGANRDICRDVSIANGRAVAKPLMIGEAGHSFYSEAEGPSVKWLANCSLF